MARKPKLGSIYRRGRVYWIKYYRPGNMRPVRESSRSESYADAERLLKRRHGAVVTGKFAGLSVERVRMNELFDDVLEDHRLNERKSIGSLLSRLKHHLRPAFGNVRAAELSTAQIKRYMRQRQQAGAMNATINRELEVVARSLRLAERCEPPKVARVIHISMLPENNVRTGFLDDAGYCRLRAELPDCLRLLFVAGYHDGCRRGELLKLTWPRVDFANKQILLAPGTTKNGEGRTLPFYGEMEPLLLMEKAIRDAEYPDCPFVFHREGKPLCEYRRVWGQACERAGLPGLLFHDLRRSAVRNMRLAGIPENVAQRISGHKTRSMFDRYNIVRARDLKDAAERMNQRFRESLGTILGTVGADAPEGGETGEAKPLPSC